MELLVPLFPPGRHGRLYVFGRGAAGLGVLPIICLCEKHGRTWDSVSTMSRSRPAEYVRFYDEAPPPVITPLDVQERVPAGILGVFGQ